MELKTSALFPPQKRLEHVYADLHTYNETSRNTDLVSSYRRTCEISFATTASNRVPPGSTLHLPVSAYAASIVTGGVI